MAIPKDSIDRLVYFQREVNKLFKTVFSNDPGSSAKMESLFPLPIDIYDEKNAIYFDVEIPGVDANELSLHVSNDLLIVEGIKRENKPSGMHNFICMERTFGKFRRVIEIPITVNMGKVKASYQNGILCVSIDKISDRRGERRQIPIEILQ